jgi:hypothetical protein
MPKFGALDNATAGSHTEREWLDLLEQWNWRCFYCAEPVQRNSPDPNHEATKDHMVPISRGGVDYIANIVPACRRCNELKGNKTIEEFRAERVWVQSQKSTEDIRCESRPSDSHRDWELANLPTLEIAAMWKRAIGNIPDKRFPEDRTPEWYANRKNILKAQADSMIRRREQNKRWQLENAGQLTLPIFGDGTARKLAQSEESCMPFKGMNVQEKEA